MKLVGNKVLENSFYQLIFVYFGLIFLISLGFLDKFVLHFELFALLIGLISIFVVFSVFPSKSSFSISRFVFLFAVLVLVGSRLVPYMDNSVPLGYDPGIYKSLFEHNYDSLQEGKLSETGWGKVMYLQGVSFIVANLMNLGFSSDFLVSFGLIFFDMLILFGLYLVGKEYFNESVGVLSSLLYSFSIIAFNTFYLNYYKNIIGIFLILLGLYLFAKKKYVLGSLIGGFIGGLHRPSFAVFGGSYFFNWLRVWKWRLLISGVSMLVLAGIFYIDRIEIILSIVYATASSFVSSDVGAGTFLSFESFIFGSLIYISLFWIGFFKSVKEKRFDMLFFWLILNGCVVVFKLFFYNRMIIFLNVIMIIYAGYGFYLVMNSLNKLRWVLFGLVVISGGLFIFNHVSVSEPLITSQEMDSIVWIDDNVADDAFVFSLHKFHSPWVEGWTSSKVVAPGLFDYNTWDKSQWEEFWSGNYSMIGEYSGDKYVFIGKVNSGIGVDMVDEGCFDVVYSNSDSFVLEFVCD